MGVDEYAEKSNERLACSLALPLLPRQDRDEGGGGPAVGPIEFDHL